MGALSVPMNAAEVQIERVNFDILPGEIRNNVYKMAVVKEEGYMIHFPEEFQKHPEQEIDSGLPTGMTPLFKFGADIEAEARYIFYAQNHFIFKDGAINFYVFGSFCDIAGPKTISTMSKVSILRSIQIGTMKKRTQISFTAKVDREAQTIKIERPPYVRVVCVPGMARLHSKYAEPCHCQVDKLAKEVGTPRRGRKVNGRDMFTFLEHYALLLEVEATEEMCDICPECDTMRRF